MRNVLLALALAACAGPSAVPAGPASVAVPVPGFAASRWVPANPTYLLAAKTVGDGQRAVRETLEQIGVVGGFEEHEAEDVLARMLRLDPLSPDALHGIGVDLGGGMAIFSEDITPTFVLRLGSPEAFTAFLDQQRTKGLATVSQMVDGVELFTAKLGPEMSVAWAIDHEWLWVHFGAKGAPADWFEHSHKAASAAWSSAWSWAQQHAGKAGLVGYARIHDMLAPWLGRLANGKACLDQLGAVDRIGLAFDADGTKVGARVTLDLGSHAAALASHVMPPPPGWQTVAQTAPLQLQWNVDLEAVTGWLSPCMQAATGDPDAFATVHQYGVRTARALVLSVDPGDKSGAGAVAMDLSSGAFLQSYVDKASHFASDKTFGAYRGHHVSIPFVAKLDYIFDAHVAIAAMGDGVMDRVTAGAPAGAPPVFSLAVRPDGMSKDAWIWLLDQVDAPSPRRMVERLSAWREAHLSATLDGTSLVVEVAGNHK